MCSKRKLLLHNDFTLNVLVFKENGMGKIKQRLSHNKSDLALSVHTQVHVHMYLLKPQGHVSLAWHLERRYSIMYVTSCRKAESSGDKVRRPDFESQLHHLLTFLSIHFLSHNKALFIRYF